MSSITVLLLVLGFILLMEGAEWLVRGAARLGANSGISPLAIGLTVVALGTSAPELAVNLQSALGGHPDIAVGNVIGSNILNVLFILGISALITPLSVSAPLIRLDVALMLATSSLVYLLALDGQFSRLDGGLLFIGMIIYLVFSTIKCRRENMEVPHEYTEEYGLQKKGILKSLGLILLGLLLLALGARWLVAGAVEMARFFGVSELIVGLTLIAIGTSLPEAAASVVASLRGERDIAVGNVVGSNLFNLLAVLGLTSLATPAGIPISPAALNFDIPVMLAASIACLPILFTSHLIARWEGILFLGYYLAYTAYLLLYPLQHHDLETYNSTMLGFVIPLTAITLLVLVIRARRKP
ncbi:Na+/Ca+ antiporter, CaCA family [Nitrosococcus halophilus Nc 4]|uniref:Na+/Ca+ antiporter, CaCA family n=1 Tax=Nitrosococcus halophilus (strain Nc4) TaxID=472759 RepID=D5C2H7_NITHN|nr:calcium/sodium antiporter [Nitrosococcus halophilus]ADE14836.1 Na+/Ca+ antiporter, CaCA family [Nitrosococcus halophilus Nc 4]